MGSDGHERFRHMIDESVAGPVQEEQSLREHLQACAPCQEYLAATHRVIAGLGGFSFAVDNARIYAVQGVYVFADNSPKHASKSSRVVAKR